MSIMNTVEVATLLRVSKKTVLELAAQKKIPCRKVGREWRFIESEILRWMGAGRVER